MENVPTPQKHVNWARLNFLLFLIVMILGVLALFVLAAPFFGPRETYYLAVPIEGVKAESPPSVGFARKTPSLQLNVPYEAYGDWIRECSHSQTGGQDCILSQRILWDDNKSEAMLVQVFMVNRDETRVPRMRLVVPLGVFLPSGVKVDLEGQKEIYVPFQACINGGCFVNLDLAPDVVVALNNAKTLRAAYQQWNQTVGNVEISLNGFGDGLKVLEE